MNFSLAKEIYGSPWYIDSFSLQHLGAILKHFQAGNSFDSKEKKNNSFEIKSCMEIGVEIPECTDDIDLQNISIIHLDGPLTKRGGDSHCGTSELAEKLLEYDNESNVIGHILMIDSGGGSVNAIPDMADAISACKKPVVTFVDGMAASAAYYIASYSKYIFAKRNEDIIGSIGTMIEFTATPKVAEDKVTGVRTVRIYADGAFNKNFEFESAINDLNFTPIKEKILNPHNEKFIKDIKQNRPKVLSLQLTGSTFNAFECVGTLIDAIGSFQDAINKVVELSTASSIINNNPKQQQNMNAVELKANHADVYNAIVLEGAAAERLRVKAWMAFAEIDATAVNTGIESGESVTAQTITEMSAKAVAAATLRAIELGNAKAITTGKEEEVKTPEQIELAKFESELKASMNLKSKEV